MQLAAGGGAGAGDIAAVLWDLRLHQYDMKHRQLSPFSCSQNTLYRVALANSTVMCEENRIFRKITTNPAGFLQNAGNDRRRGRRRSGSVVSHKKRPCTRKNLEEISFINSPEILDFPKIFVIIKIRTNKEEKTHGFSAARRVFLEEDSSLPAHSKPLMLEAVLFCPILKWMSDKLLADGVQRFCCLQPPLCPGGPRLLPGGRRRDHL